MFRKKSKLSFADIAVSSRNIKNPFLETIQLNVNWDQIENLILQNYNKGKRADGRPAFRGLLLFKMCLLQEWYGVTAKRMEALINDTVSMSHFIEQSLDEKIPSAATFLSFKRELLKSGVYAQLRNMVNDDLANNHYTIKKGSIKYPFLLKTFRKKNEVKSTE